MNKPGIILKICVTNFVTYTYAEMYPGPHLNMIVGPNGTGKSTMVAAIILGLGGNPKTVGRGSKVSEYIKHNCQQARIDVTLKNDGSNSNTTTVTREFDLQDKSVWRINGSRVPHSDMLKHIKLYNIQVDNLCQFLPQDRVQDFAKMNKQELLKQTKKALCRDDLIEKQQNLIAKRDRQKAILETFSKKSKKLQGAKDANLRLESKVTNFNKRKQFLTLIKTIDRKIAWRRYELLAEKRDEIKADKTHALEILNTHKKSAEPVENAIRNAQKTVLKLRESLMRDENNSKQMENEIQKYNDKLRKLKESIKELNMEMKAKISEISQREQEIRTTNMKLRKLQADKEDLQKAYGDGDDIQKKLQQCINEIKQISNKIGVIEGKISELQILKHDKMHEMRGLQDKLAQIENVKQQRLEYLRRLDSDAYKATLWLRENSQHFKGQVFEPVMLELNVINSSNAVYIENTVPVRDRVALTCTNKDDMNSLIQSLRDNHNLRINIVYSDPNETIHTYQPRIPIERLKQYGMYAYLSSLITAPSPIITYLCKNYRIHNTPVGNDQTNKCFEDVPKEISCFFSDRFRYSCSYSRYTGEKIIRQNEIKSDGCLSISVDLAKLENIQGQLNDNQRDCERFDDQIQELQNRITQLGERKERLSESLKNTRNICQNIQTIDSRIRVVNNTIEQLRQGVTTEAAVRKECNTNIKNVVKQMLNLNKVLQEKFKALNALRCNMDLKQLEMGVMEKQITFLENKVIDIRQLCEEAEQTLQSIKKRYDEITVEAKKALQKGKDLSNGFTPDQDGFNEFRKEYDELSDEMEELERRKSKIVGKIECLTTADDDEMREYEQRSELIQQLEDSLRSDSADIENINRKINRMETDYLTPLQELVDEINSKFSAAFEKMGCAGEVSIYKGDHPQDYGQYGLSIKVTYRSGEPLQELNNVTQSGGERAVATATYMLSLQELTPVPFRCVDEINQGMDEINERRIFELLFDSTSRPNTSQYFLITPKLMSNLNYVPTMKIHFIHNGPFVVSQTDWNRIKL